jgi:serine/threonine protein kinase
VTGRIPQPPPDAGRHPATAGKIDPIRQLARGYQGAVSVVATSAGRRIVKEAMGPQPLRALRRAMLRREFAVYQRLRGIAGVPQCYGLENGERLLLEYVEGPSLRDLKNAPAERERFFDALLALIQAVHRAGVAHADLKRKDNILVRADGQPVLIDFGSAVLLREDAGALRRWLFRQACRLDLNAWVKLKYRRRYSAMSPSDRQYYRPTFLERAARLVRQGWRKLSGRRWRKARRAGAARTRPPC